MAAVSDLWAVKAYEDVGGEGGWVCVGIYRTQMSALNAKRSIRDDLRRHYPLVDPKVVHPDRRIVEDWLAVGNKIYD
jgi:hypothetical protein